MSQMDEDQRIMFSRIITEMQQPQDQRNVELIQKFFLSLPGIDRILVKEQDELKHMLKVIPNMLKYKEFEETEIVFRGTSKLNNVIIILEGEITVLEAENFTIESSLIEYVTLLFHLRKNAEIELSDHCYSANQNAFPTYEDNFDTFLRNLSKGKSKNPIFLENPQIQDKASDAIKSIKHEIRKKFTVDEYIKFYDMTRLNKFNSIRFSEKRIIDIPKYHIKRVYKTGEIIDLDIYTSNERKRILTAIATTPCKVASFESSEYDILLKNTNEKLKKKFLQVIYSSSLFRKVSSYLFEKKFYNFFNYRCISRGEFLFKEGEESENIFFLVSGELEIYTHKNIIQLNNAIVDYRKCLKGLEGRKNKYDDEDDYEETKENIELLTNKSFLTEIENKTLFDFKKVKIGIIDHREIIGLHDFVNMTDRKFLVNGKCLTQLEVYEISFDHFLCVCAEAKVQEEGNPYFINKLTYMIKRLEYHKTNLYDSIKKKDYDNRKNYLKMQSMEIESQRKNRLYRLEYNAKLGQAGKNIIGTVSSNYKKECEQARRKRLYSFELEEEVKNERQNTRKRNSVVPTDDNTNAQSRKETVENQYENYNLAQNKYRKAIINRHLYDNLFHNYVLNDENKLTVDEHFDHRVNEHDRSAKVKCINLVDPLALENFNERFCMAVSGFSNKK